MGVTNVFFLCSIALYFVLTGAIPTIEVHRVHEIREHQPHGWTRPGSPHQDTVLPFKIALAQSNLHLLDDLLMSVSSPDSEQYGQHWSADKVANTFAPSADSVDAVRSWLWAHNIAPARINHSRSQGWLNFYLTVKEAERLMKTKYTLWEHETGKSSIACDHYHIPEHLKDHVGTLSDAVNLDSYADPSLDYITPTINFDINFGSPGRLHNKRSLIVYRWEDDQSCPAIKTNELGNCTDYITPDCLRLLYGIPIVHTNLQKNA